MDNVGLVDIAILCLLMGGMGYGWVLSRRLERLRGALVAFGPALDSFCTAVERSERSVQNLRSENGKIEDPNITVFPVKATVRTPDEREMLMAALSDIIRGRRL